MATSPRDTKITQLMILESPGLTPGAGAGSWMVTASMAYGLKAACGAVGSPAACCAANTAPAHSCAA